METIIEEIKDYLMSEKGLSGDPHVVSQLAADILDYLIDTQVVTYAYDDPNGEDLSFPSVEELSEDAKIWCEEYPVYLQIEFRSPIMTLSHNKEVSV